MIRATLSRLDTAGDAVIPSLVRLTFAAALAGYFWASALTKLGDGPFSPSLGAYAQIFPRAMEAVSFDAGQLGLWHRLVVLAGTYAEFILPALIIVGLLTRLAALGMIGFVVVQSLTDIIGHDADPTAIGAWFDRIPDSAILDQRLFWITLFVALIFKGAGPISLDRLVASKM